MNLLQHLYPGDAIASFAIRVLIEISVVSVAALLFARLFARKNPALRHGVCVCALFCVLLAPVSTYVLQSAGWRTYEIHLDHEASQKSGFSPANSTISAPTAPSPRPFWTIERVRSGASLTLIVWLAGTLLLLVRLVRTAAKVNRMRRSSYSVESEKVASVMVDLTHHDGLPEVPVRYLTRLHSPVVVGTLHPSVILPEKLLNQLDESQLRSVLAHELAHVRNRDPLIGFVQRFVEASYWPHPLVHLLNRDLVRAREEVCDNAALHRTTAPLYAETLLCVALGITPNSHPAGVLGLMTPHWKLEERVKGLLDPKRRLTTKMNTRHLALMTVILATGTTVIAGTRVVAAPNPTQQEVVELTTHVNKNGTVVSVTAVKTKTAPAKGSPNKVKIYANPSMKPDISTRYKVNAVQIGGKEKTYTITTDKAVNRVRSISADDAVVVEALKHGTDALAYTITTKGVDLGKSKSDTVVVESSATAIPAPGVVSKTLTITSSDAVKERLDRVSEKSSDTVVRTDSKPIELKLKVLVDPSSRERVVHVTENKALGDSQRIVLSDRDSEIHLNSDNLKFEGATEVKHMKLRRLGEGGNGDQVIIETREEPVQNLENVELAYVTDAKHHTTQVIPFSGLKSSPTTVYIQGGKIKVVGDKVNVVYLDPEKKKQAPAKPKKSKTKPKG